MRSPDAASAALAEVAARYWETALRGDPLTATSIGYREHDAELPPIHASELAALAAELEEERAAAASIGDESLDDADRVTRSALLQEIDARLAFTAADLAAFTVDPLGGPQVSFLNVPDYQGVTTVDQGRDMVERWRAMGPWIDALTTRQRASLADGRPPVKVLVKKVIDELAALLARPDAEWPLAAPAWEERPAWTDAGTRAFADDLLGAVRDGIRPAFMAYRAFLADEALAAARDDGAVGIGHLDGGEATYRALASAHTTVQTDPAQLHAIGLAEIERIDVELTALGRSMLGASDLPDTLRRLRSDPELHFTSGDEIVEVAEQSLVRASAGVPDWFGLVPAAPCEVTPMGAHEEEHSTIAYYRDPAADGSRPGRYHVNRSHPQSRPRYEAEALAFHEAVPGHHLQVALAQEQIELPPFRRHSLSTAYVEGWGLYAERLSDEMGLYSGDLDRIGIASFDAWRASRLVVDTGMHALGWSRSRAIAFMTDHTALGTNNIANEVDRYIAWPGQALAYKVGQLELLRLRAEARERLGGRFDIRTFHDAVLGAAPLPLAVLRSVVERELA